QRRKETKKGILASLRDTSAFSEVHLDRQLDLASGIPRIRYFAELSRAERHTGIAEARVVHQIEELAAQLHMPAFQKRPAFVDGEVQVVQTVGAEDVAAGVAECVERRLSERGGVEPQLRRAVGDGMGIAHDVRILRRPAGHCADIGYVAGKKR